MEELTIVGFLAVVLFVLPVVIRAVLFALIKAAGFSIRPQTILGFSFRHFRMDAIDIDVKFFPFSVSV